MRKSIIKLSLQCFGIFIAVYNGCGQSLAQQNDMVHNPFASVLEVKEKKANIQNSNHLYNAPTSQKDLLITNPLNRDLSKVDKSKLKEDKKHSKKKNDYTNQLQQKNSNVIENVSINKVISTQLKQELRKTYQEIELQNLPSKITVARENQEVEEYQEKIKGDGPNLPSKITAAKENQEVEEYQEKIKGDGPILVGIVRTKSRNFALIKIDEKRFWVEKGSYLEQSELIEIQEKQVILRKGQEKIILKLMEGN